MPTFRVSFYKVLSDDTGHEHRTCQRAIEVEAPSAEQARASGERLFCAMERVAHWSLYADSAEVEPLARPVRTGTRAR